jgi:hypothetical protein
MKNIIIVLCYQVMIMLMVAIPFSCSDFLEKPPQGKLVSSNFPTSASDAEQAVNAIYNTLRVPEYNFGLYPILDIMSDDAHKGSNLTDQRAVIGPYDNFTHIGTETSIKNWYATLYQGVKRANVVIENVPKIAMDETMRTRFVAEARLLRGFFYLDIVRAWGDVPKITTVVAPLGLPRSPASEIYTLIEEDFTYARDNLWERNDDRWIANDRGRVTVGTANALLARYYLWRGNFPQAEVAAMAVINSHQYALAASFGLAHSEAGEQGVESVFEAGAIRVESLPQGGNQYGNVQGVRGNPNRGWGFNRPSFDLINSFEPDDPRLDSTILDVGEWQDGIKIAGDTDTPDTYTNSLVYPGFPNGIQEKECYNQKVWTPGTKVSDQFGYNRRFVRYADVLLMAAEALNKNGKPEDALVYLNEVRARARGSNPTILLDITETNADALNEIILHERRVELALEGLRFWDLIRTNKATTVLAAYGYRSDKHNLLAIPRTEIDLNGWQNNSNW